jgi:hypothetical protein
MSTWNIKIIIFWGVKRGWCVRLTTLPPSMSRLSRQWGSLTPHNPIGLQGLLRNSFTLLYFWYMRLLKDIFSRNYLNRDIKWVSELYGQRYTHTFPRSVFPGAYSKDGCSRCPRIVLPYISNYTASHSKRPKILTFAAVNTSDLS